MSGAELLADRGDNFALTGALRDRAYRPWPRAFYRQSGGEQSRPDRQVERGPVGSPARVTESCCSFRRGRPSLEETLNRQIVSVPGDRRSSYAGTQTHSRIAQFLRLKRHDVHHPAEKNHGADEAPLVGRGQSAGRRSLTLDGTTTRFAGARSGRPFPFSDGGPLPGRRWKDKRTTGKQYRQHARRLDLPLA